MFLLRITEDWSSQISRIRNANTDDTHLIRFDNTYYRLCRPGPESFRVKLAPGTGRVDEGITLTLQVRDLYVTHIGTRLFGRYASTLDCFAPQALTLDQAVHELPTAQGDRLFELQSLLVFCVAESLRNDHIATAIDKMIRATMGNPILRGVPIHLPIREYLPIARTWGQTSDALFQALSLQAQGIILRPRSELSLAERRFYERVNLTQIPPQLAPCARMIKVLKRPG
jgi:hypothetical protein